MVPREWGPAEGLCEKGPAAFPVDWWGRGGCILSGRGLQGAGPWAHLAQGLPVLEQPGDQGADTAPRWPLEKEAPGGTSGGLGGFLSHR